MLQLYEMIVHFYGPTYQHNHLNSGPGQAAPSERIQTEARSGVPVGPPRLHYLFTNFAVPEARPETLQQVSPKLISQSLPGLL